MNDVSEEFLKDLEDGFDCVPRRGAAHVDDHSEPQISNIVAENTIGRDLVEVDDEDVEGYI